MMKKTLPNKLSLSLTLIVAALLSFITCNSTTSISQVSFTSKTATYSFDVEIADSDEKRTIGLMNRGELADNAGMLFIWDTDVNGAFWMKDTYISLDIIFIDKDKKVVYMKPAAKPLSEEHIQPDKNYRYVLEVNRGFIEKSGIKIGDTLSF